ncbi:MAG: hypothetical protein ACI8W3_000431 [Myxococcota bacterium]
MTILQWIPARWNAFLFCGHDPQHLGVSRGVMGLGLLAYHIQQFRGLVKVNSDSAVFYFVKPIWYFELLGVERFDPELVGVGFALLLASSLMFALGAFTRTSAFLMLGCIFLLVGMSESMTGQFHHRYIVPVHIVGFFLLSRSGDVFSIDAWRRRKHGAVTSLEIWEASWPIRASQLYLCSFYFWSALAKFRASGLAWFEPDNLQHMLLVRSVRYGFVDGVPAGSALAYELAKIPELVRVFAMSSVALELLVPVALLIPRTCVRVLIFLGLASFHLSTTVLMNTKFLVLPVFYVLFFDLSWLVTWFRVSILRTATSESPAIARRN